MPAAILFSYCINIIDFGAMGLNVCPLSAAGVGLTFLFAVMTFANCFFFDEIDEKHRRMVFDTTVPTVEMQAETSTVRSSTPSSGVNLNIINPSFTSMSMSQNFQKVESTMAGPPEHATAMRQAANRGVLDLATLTFGEMRDMSALPPN